MATQDTQIYRADLRWASQPQLAASSFSPVRVYQLPPTPPHEKASPEAFAPPSAPASTATVNRPPVPPKIPVFMYNFVLESYHEHRSRLEREAQEQAQSGSGPVPLDSDRRQRRDHSNISNTSSGSSEAPQAYVPGAVAFPPTPQDFGPARHSSGQSHHQAAQSATTSLPHQAPAFGLDTGDVQKKRLGAVESSLIPSITVTEMDHTQHQAGQSGAQDIYDLPVYGPDLPKIWPATAARSNQVQATQSQVARSSLQYDDLPEFGPDLPKNWAAMVRQHEQSQLREQQKIAAPVDQSSDRHSPLMSFRAKPESPVLYPESSPESSPNPSMGATYLPPPQKVPPPPPVKDTSPPLQNTRPASYTQLPKKPLAPHAPLAADILSSRTTRSYSNEAVPTGPAPAYSYHPISYSNSSYHSSAPNAHPAPPQSRTSQQSLVISHPGSQAPTAGAATTPPAYLSQHLHPHQSPNPSNGSFSPPLDGRSSTDPNAMSRSRSRSPSAPSKRSSWFGLGKGNSRPTTPVETPSNSLAWFVARDGRRDFDLTPLLIGHRATELWDTNGDTSVYIFPPERRMGPSFKIDSEMLAASPLQNLLVKKEGNTDSPASELAQRNSYFQSPPKQQYRLLFPTPLGYGSPNSPPVAHGFNGDDIEALIATRNFFAFINRRPLLSSRRNPSFFSILLAVARFLEVHKFSNNDGSTFGTAIMQNVNYFVDALGLADVRESRQKTIESLVLGEKLKCWPLYNEAFAHAVGKYDEIIKLNSPTMTLLSELSQRWLDLSAIDLSRRLRSLNDRVRTFDFPSLFAGVANRSDEQKMVRFNKWKSSFNSAKNWFSAYYKTKYGSWPPKAKSKKNTFEESGLNRLLMKEVYNDLSNLYNMLVDRTDLTPRDVVNHLEAKTEDMMGNDHKALRKLLDEFDKSDVPVCPPIPFDVPLRPNLESSANPQAMDANGQNARKLSSEELHQALTNSYNYDIDPSPFIESFKAFERKEGNNKTVPGIIDQRNGHWIFIYVMLQCLPLVIIDAPNLRFSEGVEYFLCQHPINGPSWTANGEVKRSWYDLGNGGGYAHLPSHVVEHGVDGIFQRSHCWVVAQKWIEATHMDEDEGLRLQLERVGLSPSPMPHAHRQTQGQGQAQGRSGSGNVHPVASAAVPGFTVTGPGSGFSAGSSAFGRQQQQQFGQYQRPPGGNPPRS